MMCRASAQKQLDAAVKQSGVTIVRGLPRVGRSTFLTDWQNRHTNAKRCQTVADIQLEPGVFVLDHVDVRSVDAIVAKARAADETRARTRLVIAPIDLVTAESLQTKLTGIASEIEITPFRVEEIAAVITELSTTSGPVDATPTASAPTNQEAIDPYRHWLRGGFPESLEAENDKQSLTWRRAMLDGVFKRDYTEWGVERAFPLADVLLWLANQNGSEFDATKCTFAKQKELRSAIYVLKLLGLVRYLPNYPADSNKSMVRKQKVFVRDTGVLHALLGIETSAQLRSHTGIGGSFESYAIETLILAANGCCRAQFYRKEGNGSVNEIDLVLDFPSQNGRLVAIECKVSPAEQAKRGFYNGCAELGVEDQDRFVVHSGDRPQLDQSVRRLDLKSAIKRIIEIAQEG